MQVGRWWKVFSAFIPSWHPPPGTSRSSGRPAMQRPGTKSKCPVLTWSGSGLMSICSFCMFLLLEFYGGNLGNTGRTCKLHTERPGIKPRHVARCGTWTHDLLAVRQQCYALCHRAPNVHIIVPHFTHNATFLFVWLNLVRYNLIAKLNHHPKDNHSRL